VASTVGYTLFAVAGVGLSIDRTASMAAVVRKGNAARQEEGWQYF
jgi:hypothetical protein